jgi:ribosomal protein L15
VRGGNTAEMMRLGKWGLERDRRERERERVSEWVLNEREKIKTV